MFGVEQAIRRVFAQLGVVAARQARLRLRLRLRRQEGLGLGNASPAVAALRLAVDVRDALCVFQQAGDDRLGVVVVAVFMVLASVVRVCQ